MTETSLINSIDFFIRYACIGQLFILAAYLFYKPSPRATRILGQLIPLLLILGILAYLLLTAPFSPRPQGMLRSWLLFFTHGMPALLWLYGKHLFDDDFDPRHWSLWPRVGLGLLASFYIYVFLLRGGGGYWQMLSHWIALAIILHLLATVLLSWRGDLIEQRRLARFWWVLLIGLFYLMLDLVELSRTPLNRHHVFMLMNASICLLGTSVTSVLLFFRRETPAKLESAAGAAVNSGYSRLLLEENALAERLQSFIANKGYLQPDLGIRQLAEQLECAEHHLRKLINQRLGYSNFNAFLNHYRIEEARLRLVETSLPVLSIALDLGYGSIASFNRAFKAIVGLTPTSYRASQQGGSI